MYCDECQCEYTGWQSKCPVCGSPLAEKTTPNLKATREPVSYDAIVDLIKENGGELQIEMEATEVGSKITRDFPYFGYGYAWVKRLQGDCQGIPVEFTTTEVIRKHSRSFPYNGYGFAWSQEMDGHIGGHPVSMKASKVEREKKWIFPYFGIGRAWMQEMTGGDNQRLRLSFETTEVGRSRKRRFPYRGCGFGWAKKGILTLELNE